MSEDAISFPPPGSDIGENLSVASSSSSFIPIDKATVFDAIQVINENKEFNLSLLDYIEKTAPISDVGNNYHIVSVFGSQSTGKSTLLNRLFNTNFDVMDESRRQQTTKGIWMAYSPAVSSNSNTKKNPENVFVMDVEGTDGRERGEDQEFERKAALFALATSEVLIINIWETQIGLYQGANMGLLKTVFEVNLSLFGKSKLQSSDHKVLLLFVIRDHLGVTPKENLASTINTDLKKLWDDLSKPADLADLRFEQFFDVSFHTMAHKVLQEDRFLEDVKLLGDKFVDKADREYLFKDNYHHNIPVDGWTMYAENCWRQIDENKDLDLPTQQILVARFKCDEILNAVYEDFITKYNSRLFEKVPENNKEEHQIDYEDVGHLMLDLKQDALESFALGASRYNPFVYEQKREELDNKITQQLKELINIYATFLTHESLQEFQHKFSKKSDIKFVIRCEKVVGQINNVFTSKLSHLTLENLVDITEYKSALKKDLDELIAKQQVIELSSIINKATKKLNTSLSKLITFEVNDAKETTWDNVLQGFKSMIDDFLTKYTQEDGTIDFGLGIDKDLTNTSVEKFKFKAWTKFHDLINKTLSTSTILAILKERFDEKFRYDENGLPRLYSNEFELEQSFGIAKVHAVKVLPILTIAKLADSTEILPEYDVFSKESRLKYDGVGIESDDEEDEGDEPRGFAHIISESEKAEILSKFKREVDAKYIETKRSIIQHVSQIPYYIYLVILVLGWNEFMAIIRNPIFFTFTLLLGAGVYVMYQLNLLKPATIVVQRMADEVLMIVKAKLKELLVDDHEFHGNNMQKISQEIEMDDISKRNSEVEKDL